MDTTVLRSAYQYAVSVNKRDIKLPREQAEQLASAHADFQSAREALGRARNARKAKEQRIADAEAAYQAASAALKVAQEPESEAEAKRYIEAQTIVEGILAVVAAEVLGGPVKYINHWPTDEVEPDRYADAGTSHVWKTELSDTPMEARVAGWERGDIRIRWRGNGPIDLSVEVQLLDNEAEPYSDGLRQEYFGRKAEVTYRVSRYDRDEKVEVHFGGSGARSIEAAKASMEVYRIAIVYAEAIEAIAIGKGAAK